MIRGDSSSRSDVVASHASATRFEGRPRDGCGSPLLIRAEPTRTMPAPTSPVRPAASCQSRARVRGDRPASTWAMISGHASSVEVNRASTLFDGISRSEYPTAPSTRTSDRSPGFRAYRPISALLQSRPAASGRLSLFVDTSFALRGAPCGDDPRPVAALGGYHQQEPVKGRVSEDERAALEAAVARIRKEERVSIEDDRIRLVNETPCFRKFASALTGSQSKFDTVGR